MINQIQNNHRLKQNKKTIKLMMNSIKFITLITTQKVRAITLICPFSLIRMKPT